MSNKTASREPAAPLTLADVIAKIQSQAGLPVRRKHDLTSAVRCLCRLLARPPSDVIANPTELRQQLARISPNSTGLSRGRVRNLKSLVGQALLLVGVTSLPRRSRAPLPQPWRDLLARLDDRYQRSHLTRFARYCADRDIAPEMVDDTIMNRFGEALRKDDHAGRPKQVHRTACLTWNKAFDSVPGWPRRKLRVPNNRKDYALPLTAFPDTFRADVEAYFTHIAHNNLFAEASDDLFAERPRKPVSPMTIRNRRLYLSQLATALVSSGRDPATIRSLRDLVDIDAAKTALRFFFKRNGERKTGQLHNFALFLVNVAKDWVKVPPEHLAQLREVRRQVDPGETGLTEKNRLRLLQFKDRVNVATLVNLPDRLVADALRHDRGGVTEALIVQTAVAIAIVLAVPMRIKNLANLNLERHVVRSRLGTGAVVHLVIPKGEVKNKEPLEFELSAPVVELLDLYIQRFRPRLAKASSSSLFPVPKRDAKAPHHLSDQISQRIKRETGLKMNTHLFRHLAAYLYLKAHPGEYETVRLLLGHKSIETTIAFYCGLEQDDAFRRFDRVIDSYRPADGGHHGASL